MGGDDRKAVPKTRAAHQSALFPRSRRPSTAEVFSENAPYAWRVLRRLGVAEADVDDVCQEVFVTVHRRLSEFEGRSTIRTWVYGICVRTASDYRKRAHVRHEIASESVPDTATGPDQEADFNLRQARDTLDRILDGLDEEKRAVFVLYEIEEISMADVATVVGCPLQTAYSRLHAARRDVEAALARLHSRGDAGGDARGRNQP
jgi:RNA polymerase sigma-70 factor (ECF subfamily)